MAIFANRGNAEKSQERSAAMPTRNVNFLTDELDHFVLQKVESARYENASEVVRAALRAAAGWLCWLLFRPAAAGLARPV